MTVHLAGVTPPCSRTKASSVFTWRLCPEDQGVGRRAGPDQMAPDTESVVDEEVVDVEAGVETLEVPGARPGDAVRR